MSFTQTHHSDEVFRDLELGGEELGALDFQDCRFVGCDFSEGRWHGIRFLDCEFEGCDLSNLRLAGARFSDVTFRTCKLVGVDFAGADLLGPRFHGCKLDYSLLTRIDLRHGCLEACSAREVDLTGADLRKVDCAGTDFTGATFSGTDLREADLSAATGYVLRPADNRLEGAKVTLPAAIGLLHGLGVELVD